MTPCNVVLVIAAMAMFATLIEVAFILGRIPRE